MLFGLNILTFKLLIVALVKNVLALDKLTTCKFVVVVLILTVFDESTLLVVILEENKLPIEPDDELIRFATEIPPLNTTLALVKLVESLVE